jgi:hypothetical protein
MSASEKIQVAFNMACCGQNDRLEAYPPLLFVVSSDVPRLVVPVWLDT